MGACEIWRAVANLKPLVEFFSTNLWTVGKPLTLFGPDGTKATSFEEIAKVGSGHFKNLFQDDHRETIDAILQVASFLPQFINSEENENLMVEVSREELMRVLQSF
jgi:hypothetical protein